MSPSAPTDSFPASLPPSVVILGNDAQLAARPATPVQLAHACLAAGYRAVVPASWGDELVAAATTRLVAGRGPGTAIHCACPHVARRVLAVGTELSPFLLSLVPPPVAAARYVRHFSPGGVRVTYVGRCPAAADDSIDARLTPEELFAQLAERGIRLEQQSPVFESVIPPDRRRHRSLPGGVPSPESLWAGPRPTIVDLVTDEDLASELADKLLSETNSLVDVAPFVGCVCAGAVRGAVPADARAAMTVMEPPRAPSPVVDELALGSLEMPLPMAARSSAEAEPGTPPPARWQAPAPERAPAPPFGAAEPLPDPAPRRPRLTPPGLESPLAGLARRRPAPVPRVAPGAVPLASDVEGRVLPRAYVARRRTPRGMRVIPPPSRENERPIVHSVEPAAAAPAPVETPAVAVGTAADSPPAPEGGAVTAREMESPVLPRGGGGAASRVDSAGAPGGGVAGQLPPTLRASSERTVPGVRTLTSRSPRAVLAIAVTAVAVLLGVAIGYAAATRRNPPTADASSPDSVSGAYIPNETAGVVVNPAPPMARAAPDRAPVRALASSPAAGPASAGEGTPPASPPAVLVDSAAVRRAAAARADSLERESIRRELAQRRARLDTIARRISEIGPPDAKR